MVHNFLNYVKLFILPVLCLFILFLSGNAQSVEPDRISFYNVPSQSQKYILHIDYADGTDERIPLGTCSEGSIIERILNLYQATFIVEGCTEDVFQHLNVRWEGGCEFNFEDDPDVRTVTRGEYGETSFTNHYPQGIATLPIPAGTISMSVVMSYTIDGILRTGNVGFDFNESVGCVEPTLTSTPQSTEEELPTYTPTPMSTPIIPCCTYTPEPTVTPTPTSFVISVSPTPQPTIPTGLTPSWEPARTLYLPLVDY